MGSGRETTSIARLHQALRENRKGEARRIARELREVYRESDHPRSLLAFIEAVLTDAPARPAKAPVSASKAVGSLDRPSRPWHALPGADIAGMRAALGLWNQLHPGSEPLCAPGDRDAASLPREGLSPQDLARLLIGGTGALPWLDGWFVASHQLRLRVGAAPGGSQVGTAMRWEIHQWEPELKRLSHCGSISLERGAEGLHDLRLVQPFSPLLLLGGNGDGGMAEITILPFPSLLRHGLHHGELVAEVGELAGSLALGSYSLSCLERLLKGHHPRVRSWSIAPPTGSPGGWITRPSAQAWLEMISAVEPQGDTGAPGSLHLTLEGDGLPSLRALTGLARAADHDLQGEAAFVVVDPCSLRPMLQIRPGRQPAGIPGAIRVEQGEQGGTALATADTVAIRMAADASPRSRPLWWPSEQATIQAESGGHAAESRAIEVVLTQTGDQADLQFSLWSLSQQHGVEIERIWLPPCDAEDQQGGAGTDTLLASMQAEGIALERGRVEGLEPLLEGCRSRGTLLCLMTAGVCLHEPATLKVLAELLNPEEVASASCLLIHERQLGRHRSLEASSCGLMPAPLDPLHGNGLGLVQQTLQEINAIDDRSVVANLSDLVLVDPDQRHWPRLIGTATWPGELATEWLNANLHAILRGSLHRATARVSAHYRRAPRADRRFHAELTGAEMPLNRAMPELLAASTCSRRLKP